MEACNGGYPYKQFRRGAGKFPIAAAAFREWVQTKFEKFAATGNCDINVKISKAKIINLRRPGLSNMNVRIFLTAI